MAVADLDEVEFSLRSILFLAKCLRCQDAAAESPKDSGASPCHALQKAAAVNAVIVMVVNDKFRQASPRVICLCCPSCFHTQLLGCLFPRRLKVCESCI